MLDALVRRSGKKIWVMGDDDSSTTNGENGGARGGVGGGAATTTHEHDMEERLIRAIQVSGLNQSPQFKSRRNLAMIQSLDFHAYLYNIYIYIYMCVCIYKNSLYPRSSSSGKVLRQFKTSTTE